MRPRWLPWSLMSRPRRMGSHNGSMSAGSSNRIPRDPRK
jgi:hypothetical protein